MTLVPVAVNTRMPALDGSPGGRNEGAYRMRHRLACPVSEIALGFQNVYNGVASAADSFTLTASLDDGDTPARYEFDSGSPSKVMTPSAVIVQTDPQAYDGSAGGLFYTRVGCESTGSNNWPLNAQLSQDGEGYAAGSGTADLVDGGDLGGDAGSPVQGERGYGPSVVLGEPIGPAPIVIGGIGNSIFASAANGCGFVHIMLNAHAAGTGVPDAVVLDTSLGGDGAISLITSPNKDARWALLELCDYAVQEHPINDINGGASLATLQARILAIGEEGFSRGIGMIDCTTFASDNLSEEENDNRIALNDWRRDGHPTIVGVAVPAGSEGALRAGEEGHPYIGYLETADVTETTRNSSVRITEYYDDPTHLNNLGHVAVAAAVRDALLAFIQPTSSSQAVALKSAQTIAAEG